VYLQSQEAMKTAREHGFENVTERVLAGRPHGPLAEEVLEYFASLTRQYVANVLNEGLAVRSGKQYSFFV